MIHFGAVPMCRLSGKIVIVMKFVILGHEIRDLKYSLHVVASNRNRFTDANGTSVQSILFKNYRSPLPSLSKCVADIKLGEKIHVNV